jgi:hypothetical protein
MVDENNIANQTIILLLPTLDGVLILQQLPIALLPVHAAFL